MTWLELERGNPELAEYGKKRIKDRVAYIATISKTGYPRVHPVSPRFHNHRLYVFMYPNSPKGYDIQEREYYALHCQVENNEGGKGEFYVRGKGELVEDNAIWNSLRSGNLKELKDTYILFELTVDFAFSMIYKQDKVEKNRWKKPN